MIKESNRQAFVDAAIARAKQLKASSDDHTHDVGVALASVTGAISMQISSGKIVDPDGDLSEAFKGAGVYETFSDCLEEAQIEIQTICSTLE